MNSNTRAVFIEGKKIEYWNHFLCNKQFWPCGMTKKRLEKVKPTAWKDKFFWSDILQRHHGDRYTPKTMKEIMPEIYLHCLGNFAGMLHDIMIENKIIKL